MPDWAAQFQINASGTSGVNLPLALHEQPPVKRQYLTGHDPSALFLPEPPALQETVYAAVSLYRDRSGNRDCVRRGLHSTCPHSSKLLNGFSKNLLD